MRSPVDIARYALVVAFVGFGAAAVVGPAVAYGEPAPGCGSRCSGVPSMPSGSTDSDGGGGGGYKPPMPTFTKPESSFTGQTVVVRRPEIPDIPTPVVIPDPIVPTPVDIPQIPVDVPVIVAPPEPVVVPVDVPIAPPPVALPIVPEPPAAPPLPVPASPQVLLTSSSEPGTQALTVILMFTVVGAWMYGHRIASHWTTGGKTHAPTNS